MTASTICCTLSFEMPLRWPIKEGAALKAVALRMHFDLAAMPSRMTGTEAVLVVPLNGRR